MQVQNIFGLSEEKPRSAKERWTAIAIVTLGGLAAIGIIGAITTYRRRYWFGPDEF